MTEQGQGEKGMLMSSILVGLVALVSMLMAADWYLWGPRYEARDGNRPEPAGSRVGQGGYQVRLPRAA